MGLIVKKFNYDDANSVFKHTDSFFYLWNGHKPRVHKHIKSRTYGYDRNFFLRASGTRPHACKAALLERNMLSVVFLRVHWVSLYLLNLCCKF